jgi:hypothetical protein
MVDWSEPDRQNENWLAYDKIITHHSTGHGNDLQGPV